MKPVQSIPSADRTFTALRSLGYNLNSSIADIIDNSIEAKAKSVKIRMKPIKKKFFLYILDDGKGMSEKQLEESMRIGSERIYADGDLGKFGFGLKTASLSHCNSLTVISRSRGGKVSGYEWNMEHIKGSNNWELLKLNKSEIEDLLKTHKILLTQLGTLVLWSDMNDFDREYNSYSVPKLADNFLFKKIEKLKLYLSTVFHRFLDGSLGSKSSIQIIVNGDSLHPWDPYCRTESKTLEVKLSKDLSEFGIKGFKSKVKIRAYVLPNQENFSSEEAWKTAKGVLSWNDAQGYYIYRDGRLIRFGGWQGIKAKDEHDKLARVSIDISSEMDELFRINVNKSAVQFPELLSVHLKNKINPPVIKKAQIQYRKNTLEHTVKNKLRKQINKLEDISQSFIKETKIKTKYNEHGGSVSVEVSNPTGSYYSNNLDDFLKYGTKDHFEVVSGKLENDHIWKIICNAHEKFKVIINSDHPFYDRIYQTNSNKHITSIVDAFIIALSFAEIYNKNSENVKLFDFYKSITSLLLKRLIEKEII